MLTHHLVTATSRKLAAQFVSRSVRFSVSSDTSSSDDRIRSTILQRRSSSSTSSPAAAAVPAATVSPPTKLNEEIVFGVQNATLLLIQHGLGKRQLLEVAKGARGPQSTLVTRWQKMMQGYLGSQVHILAGLGYSPDENGVALYQYQYNEFMSTADPDTQERLRKLGRDVWRRVLSISFDVPIEQMMKGYLSQEMSIVDARNIMFKIAQKMMDPSILDSISKQIANKTAAATGSTSSNDENTLMAMKHTLLQQVLVNEVYLGDNGKLLQECGFPSGEEGYVALQCAIAEHQTDPLVAQYMGGAMMRVLQAAGLDAATREMASNINKHANNTTADQTSTSK